MFAIIQNNTVVIGKDFASCVSTTKADGWKFFMMPGVNRDIKVLGDMTMDEAAKIVKTALLSEGIALSGYAAQKL